MKTSLFKSPKAFTAIAAIGLSLMLGSTLSAQTYVEGFEDLTKTSYASETLSLNGGVQWNFTGANKGDGTSDFFIDSKSARLAGTTKVGSNPDTSKIEMIANKPGGIGEISFLYKQYGNDPQKWWRVEWSSNGTSWSLMDSIKADATVQLYTRTLDETNARIRIICAEFSTGLANTSRFNVDSMVVKNSSMITSGPSIIAKTPTGPNVALSTDELTITYDQDIEAGSGTITYSIVGGISQTVVVPSTSVTISGPTATISGVVLDNASSYFVTMDADVFKELGGTLGNQAITGNTEWTFTTEDTTSLGFLISLNETFDNCENSSNLMGIFHQYSVSGGKNWKCSSFGHNDSSAVSMNGGSEAGVSEENEDWLISSARFDFSAMNNPSLSFWQKSRFDGTVTREVKISTDYSGLGDPAAATWTTLNVPGLSTQPAANNWSQIIGIDLNAYKGTPFYLAFIYKCGTVGAYELTYDDILVSEQTSINGPSSGNLAIRVLGEATNSKINLEFATQNANSITAQVYDMTGRILHTETFKSNIGRNVHTLSNMNLANGMHIIRLNDGSHFGVVKAMVK